MKHKDSMEIFLHPKMIKNEMKQQAKSKLSDPEFCRQIVKFEHQQNSCMGWLLKNVFSTGYFRIPFSKPGENIFSTVLFISDAHSSVSPGGISWNLHDFTIFVGWWATARISSLVSFKYFHLNSALGSAKKYIHTMFQTILEHSFWNLNLSVKFETQPQQSLTLDCL